MGKLRSLAYEERKAYDKKLNDMKHEVDMAKWNGLSKSAIKRLKAKQHNEWQFYLQNNQIISILGRIFTEKETAIEGTYENNIS